jgi:erythritol transport system permease protein
MKTTQSVAVAPRASASLSRESILLLLLKLRTFIALFLIVGFFTATVPGFLSTGSLVIMIKHIAINAFLALGITFVIITAGIDLSIGATLGLCGMIAGWMITKGIVLPMFGIAIFPSVWVIVPLVLLIGGLIGAVNGWIIRYNVAPFICTLGTMYVLRGAAMLTSDGQTFPGLSGNPLLGNTGFDEMAPLRGLAIWADRLAVVIAWCASPALWPPRLCHRR